MVADEDLGLSDLSMASLANMTASMAIDDDHTEDEDAYNSDTNSPSDEDDSLESSFLPPISSNIGRKDSFSTYHPVSPPISPSSKIVSDRDLTGFHNLAKEFVEPHIVNSQPKFAVVISPDGYKHAFSRTWVSKKSLSSVVERPERLRATCLGIGLAQTQVALKLIRANKRVSLYAPHFEKVHGKDWATELYALCSKASSTLAKGELEVPSSWPYYDIYLSPKTAEALEGNIGAIELALDEVFTGDVNRAFVTVRPPGHHCHENEASGFCIINNAHVAIQYAKASHDISHAVILDFDLHHGDGSQDLLWKLGFKGDDGNADLPMGYFSLHDINSFPCEAGFAEPRQIQEASVCFVAHDCAVWNIHMKPYSSISEFDDLYESDYSILFKKAAEFLTECKQKSSANGTVFKPLVILSAGFDGSEFETPGMQRHKVHVPTSFYNRFTRDAVALAENYGNGHLLSLLEGGYSSVAVATGVFSHLTGLGEIEYDNDLWCPSSTTPHEIDYGMRQRWRVHPEKWTARGIQLGRALFPMFDNTVEDVKSPPSPPDASAEKPGRRRRNIIIN